jgi:hypothetical protein
MQVFVQSNLRIYHGALTVSPEDIMQIAHTSVLITRAHCRLLHVGSSQLLQVRQLLFTL